MADIPVYLIAGFLDAGKTDFINGILEDGFAQEKTLLICCEEGELEYNPAFLKNVTVVTIDDEDDLKCSYLKELEKEHSPKQVLIEYNGMWQIERLYRDVLPAITCPTAIFHAGILPVCDGETARYYQTHIAGPTKTVCFEHNSHALPVGPPALRSGAAGVYRVEKRLV